MRESHGSHLGLEGWIEEEGGQSGRESICEGVVRAGWIDVTQGGLILGVGEYRSDHNIVVRVKGIGRLVE